MLRGLRILGTKAFAKLDLLQAAGKDLYKIEWQPSIPPGKVEAALRKRGVPVYARDIPIDMGDPAYVYVPAKQRPWAEEIIFVQMAQEPLGEILPTTERRMKSGKRGYKSKTWGKPRRSGTIADELASLVDGMFDD